MFWVKSKLVIMCNKVDLMNFKQTNFIVLDEAVTKTIGLQLFLSLVSPVLFLIMGTMAVFIKSVDE